MALIIWLLVGIAVILALLGILMAARFRKKGRKMTPEERLSLKLAVAVIVIVVAIVLAVEFLVYPATGIPDDFTYFPIWIPVWLVIFLPAISRKQGKLTKKEQERQKKLVLAGLVILTIAAIAGVLAILMF